MLRLAFKNGPKNIKEATLLQRHMLMRKCNFTSDQIDKEVSSLDALLVTYLEPDSMLNDGNVLAYAVNKSLTGGKDG